MSHPTWVRGLKQGGYKGASDLYVAPYVGAWIETLQTWLSWKYGESHPTWVRGLKLGNRKCQAGAIYFSRTLRGCVD